MKLFTKLVLLLLVSWGSLYAQQNHFGALETPNTWKAANNFNSTGNLAAELNLVYYAGTTKFPNTQSAVSFACAVIGVNSRVEVPAGVDPSVNMALVQGCNQVFISDERVAAPQYCTWSSGLYVCVSGGGGGSNGFPITIGTTQFNGGDTRTSLTGLTVNGVNLQSTGSTTLFLNQAGGYTSPGSGSSSFSGTSGFLPKFTTTTGGGNSLCNENTATFLTCNENGSFLSMTLLGDGTGTGGGDNYTEGNAPTGTLGVDAIWADSGSHHLATNLNNVGVSYIPVVSSTLTIANGDVMVFCANLIDACDGGSFPSNGITNQVAGFFGLAGTPTTISVKAPMDYNVTNALSITTSVPFFAGDNSGTLNHQIVIGAADGVAPAVTTGAWTFAMTAAGITGQVWTPPSVPCTGNITATNTAGVMALTCTTTAAAGTLTGTTLASGVINSSLTGVGTLVSGATGSGFTIALGASTITGNLGVSHLNSGTLADSTHYWRGDGVWAVPAGGSSINLHVPRDYNYHLAVANPDSSAYSVVGMYTGNSIGALTGVTTPDAAGYTSLSQTTTATINTPVGTLSTLTFLPINNPTFEAIFHVNVITNMNMWVGTCAGCNATNAGFTDLGVQSIASVGFRFIAGTDTTWACYSSDKTGTTGQSSASGVAPSTTQMQKFDVIYVSGTPTYYINNTQVCASFVPTQIPLSTTAMGAEVVWKNLTASAIVGNTYLLYYGAN